MPASFTDHRHPIRQIGRLLPLFPSSKLPWLRKVKESGGASNNPVQIDKWIATKPGCEWGLRIWSYAYVVLDMEGIAKGDGARTIKEIEEKYGMKLPPCPLATTPNHGLHGYYSVPIAYQGLLGNWIQVLKGLDLRTRGGYPVIPNPFAPALDRIWLVTVEEVPIPELPAWFCQVLVDAHDAAHPKSPIQSVVKAKLTGPETIKVRKERKERHANALEIISEAIPDHLAFTLRNSGDFMDIWTHKVVFEKDNSQSAHDYRLCFYCFTRGCSAGQVLNVLEGYWIDRCIQGNRTRLLNSILPDAQDDAQPWVDLHNDKLAAKAANKTPARILSFISTHGPATPKEIRLALGLSRWVTNQVLAQLIALQILEHSQSLQLQLIDKEAGFISILRPVCIPTGNALGKPLITNETPVLAPAAPFRNPHYVRKAICELAMTEFQEPEEVEEHLDWPVLTDRKPPLFANTVVAPAFDPQPVEEAAA